MSITVREEADPDGLYRKSIYNNDIKTNTLELVPKGGFYKPSVI